MLGFSITSFVKIFLFGQQSYVWFLNKKKKKLLRASVQAWITGWFWENVYKNGQGDLVVSLGSQGNLRIKHYGKNLNQQIKYTKRWDPFTRRIETVWLKLQ